MINIHGKFAPRAGRDQSLRRASVATFLANSVFCPIHHSLRASILLLSFDLTISCINLAYTQILRVLYTINLIWVIVRLILLLVTLASIQ